MEPDEKNLEFLKWHYQQTVCQMTEYFKQYMQSWTFIVTGVFVGMLFGSKALDGSNVPLQALLIGIIPVAMLVWFLMTCWFWAMLDLYRECARKLEDKITQLLPEGMQEVPMFYRRHSESCLDGGPVHWVWLGCVSLLILAVYMAISYNAATSHPPVQAVCCFIFYFLAMVCSLWAGFTLVNAIAHDKGQCGGRLIAGMRKLAKMLDSLADSCSQKSNDERRD